MPAAKARTLVVFGAQGVIWLIICKQMSMLNDHNQLRNAPCSFYTGPTNSHWQLACADLQLLISYRSAHFITACPSGHLVLSTYFIFCQHGMASVVTAPNKSYTCCYMPCIGVNMSSRQYSRDSVFRPLVLLLIHSWHSWNMGAGSKRVWL